MSSVCVACSKALPLDGKLLTCSACNGAYHLGKSCSAVAEGTFTKMTTVKRETWLCQPCRSAVAKQPCTDSNPGDASIAQQFTAVNKKLDQLRSTVELLAGKVEELLAFKATGEKVAESVAEIQSSIDFLSSKYDTVLSTVTAGQAAVAELRSQTESLSATVVSQAALIDKLSSDLNDLEQYSRRSNFEIHGLPRKPNEDLTSVISDLAGALNISEFKTADISTVHRLPSRGDSIPPVIVQMHNVTAKEKWLSARRLLPRLVQDGLFPRLYFNDNLSRANRELFRLARSKGKEKNFRFVWTRDGKVLAKKSEGAPLIRVQKMSDLERIV